MRSSPISAKAIGFTPRERSLWIAQNSRQRMKACIQAKRSRTGILEGHFNRMGTPLQRMKRAAGWVLGSLLVSLWPGICFAEGTLRTVLVIDASSSMRSTDPKELRKAAAELYVDLARDGDQIAVTGFDGASRESMGKFITIRGISDRNALKQAIRSVGNDGNWTDFTAGLNEAKRLLDSAKDEAGDQEFVLFLTDGRCDPDPKGALFEAAKADKKRPEEKCQEQVLREIVPSLGTARLYAIGLSKAAPKAFLETAGKQSGGVGLTTDRADELPRLFADVYARLLGSRLVDGDAAPEINIAVGEGVATLDAIVVGPPQMTIALKNPAGEAVPLDNRAPEKAYFADSPTYKLLKVTAPAPGAYKLGIAGSAKGSRYAVLQNLDLKLDFFDVPDVIEIGAEKRFHARLSTPGGKIPPLEFLDRHIFSVRSAQAASQCKLALAGALGSSIKLNRGNDGVYEFSITPTARGEMCFAAALAPGPQGVLSRTGYSKIIRIVPPLKLIAQNISFGSVKQDAKARALLSLDGSVIGETVTVEITPANTNALSGDLIFNPQPLRFSVTPEGKHVFDIEVAADRNAKPGDRQIPVNIVPIEPKGYEARAQAVVLSLHVVPLSFWERYGFWIKVLSSTLIGLILLVGIFGPARFRKGTLLYYKDIRDPDLPREGSYPLSAKAKAGFYRGARVFVAASGPVRKGGALMLRAGPGGSVIAMPLENRRVLEVPREDDFGGVSGEKRPVTLNKEGQFRVVPGTRYEIDGAGFLMWTSVRK